MSALRRILLPVVSLIGTAALFLIPFKTSATKGPTVAQSLPTVSNQGSAIVSGPPIQASISDATGLPSLSLGGKEILKSDYVFWSGNWKWAGMDSKLEIVAPMHYTLVGKSGPLSLNLLSGISKTSEHTLAWDMNFAADKTLHNVMGGGIVFNFDPDSLGTEMGIPQPLPNNAGWTWARKDGSRIEVIFEPAPVALFFERGNKAELRAFFYRSDIVAGRQHYRMTMDVSKDIAIKPTLNERFGIAQTSSWTDKDLAWDRAPVDLSFLNDMDRPAGQHGFLKPHGDQLVFEDGTPACFWGTNLTSYTLFSTPKEDVRMQAKRLAALGFNLVRIHHHDSPWVNPNIFGKDADSTQSLDPNSLDKLDWWIKCLKDEGIYVWLDLHVQRAVKRADGIYGFDEIARGKNEADIKGFSYANLTLQLAIKRFNSAYLNHVNRYTGTAYKNEPAIMAVLITNENDLTYHYGNSMLPDKNVPLHNRIYMSEAQAFARSHDLDEGKTWKSWIPGPSKLFLNDWEGKFDLDMIQYLRDLGLRVPIATTSYWGDEPLYSLPALATGNIIDVHSYGGMLELEKNPLITANLVDWMAAGQVSGMPMTVSEWNAGDYAGTDRYTIPLYVASSASHEGWDAMMHFAYSQLPLDGPGSAHNWNAYNDPSLMATLPAAALLYRQKHVKEATSTYVYAPSKEQLFYQGTSPESSVALRTAAEKGRLLIALPKIEELPWLHPSPIPAGAKVITNPDQSLIDPDAKDAYSDTRELHRNWDKGIYTIDTPRTQAAMGWIGEQKINLADTNINVSTRNATIAIQSLDGMPIQQSGDILISMAARSEPFKGGKMPFRAEPVLGHLGIRGIKGLRLYMRSANNDFLELPVEYARGRYLINIDQSLNTYWLYLTKPGSIRR